MMDLQDNVFSVFPGVAATLVGTVGTVFWSKGVALISADKLPSPLSFTAATA